MDMELALDLGANMGYCIRKKDGKFESGKLNLTKKKGDTKYSKLKDFEVWLNFLHQAEPIQKIYYERVDFGMHTYATQAHGALKGILNKFAEEKGIPIKGFAVPTIKKELTGRGNASKMGMIHFAEKYVGYEIADDNEADAVGVMVTGRNGRK